MTRPKRLWSGLFFALFTALAVAVLNGIPGPSQSAPDAAPSPRVTQATNTLVDDGARKSEHFQIVQDAVDGDQTLPGDLAPTAHVQTNATITRVVDGDTVVAQLETGETATIRMLGVNTPETVDPRKPVQCFGKEASDFTKKELTGKLVRLDPDPQADERDKYGRLLRNITLSDGTDFNAELVSQGYAQAYLDFPLSPERKKQLHDLEASAKEAERGLWGAVCQK